MNIRVNQKVIKEMCGTVSFKRGDSFYRGGKLEISEYTSNYCRAIVHGIEDFIVTIEKGKKGEIHSTCTCSSLPDYTKSCQHVAAALLGIMDYQNQKVPPFNGQENKLTEDFLTLFQHKTTHKSSHQLHFEKREVLDVSFTLKPIAIGNEQYVIGIELTIGQYKLPSIREFLQILNEGKPFSISPTLQYHPKLHCFENGTDAALNQLIKVVRDEKVFLENLGRPLNHQTLVIPPSAWEGLMPLLPLTPSVIVQDELEHRESFRLQEGPLPIKFLLEELNATSYQLTINGFEQVTVFSGYSMVLFKGNVFPLAEEDCARLAQLKQMLNTPGANFIPIPREQIDLFLKKIVPGLKRIGDVTLSESLTLQLKKTPLVAKLYLDRLKNRLLAGIEFQYENVVIQPLEQQDYSVGVNRDYQKEKMILDLMEQSGFTITEGGYFMQNESLEYDFLYHVLPKLHPLVEIYMTTSVKTRLVKKSVFPKIRVKVQKERTNWLEFKFEMDGIGDKHIKEVLQALEVKQKYYRLPNGSLLSLETKEMEEIQHFLQAGPIQEEPIEASFNMPILDGLQFLDLIDKSDVFQPEESFRQFVNQLLNPSTLQYELPKRLNSILRDYQKQGFQWMKALANYGFGGVLADDMGLGKTLQSITFIVSELSTIRSQKQPVLIVCPSSLTYNWLNEFTQFAPEIQTIVIDGKKSERESLLKELGQMDVIITSYPLIRKDHKWYEQQTFHTVFFDEAQAFKNPVTQTARTVKKLQAKNRFGLTGTPVENSLEELWSIYHVIFPHLFKGLEDYSHLTRKAIARRVQPFLLRRLKSEVLTELPGKNESIEVSELLPEQKKLYAAYLAKLREDTMKHLDKETFRKNRIRILAGLTRLRQICCHPALFVEGYEGSSAKFEQLLQILEESRLSGRRVLIFSQFTKMLELIGKKLTAQEQPYFYLDGQTPSEERVELCERFNEGERNLFLISLKAGGTGLNLTGADTVILYDLWWNPAVEEQAADRAYRMGQKNVVEVIKLVARGTIEEKINLLQDKKKDLVAQIIHPGENTSTALTEEDIREILMI